ncbi:MAG: hypothetical protein IJZ85_13090 [Lachnospiraceae bacterium]|nr:hypothetical protein [Lachnospiraceae bacterium]
MKERLLVICDSDREYIGRLGRYISGKEDAGIKVACFSDRQLFAEYVSNHHVDTFLAGESWIDETICGDARRWLLLAEEDGEGEKNHGDAEGRAEGKSGAYRQIYRYQAADDIVTRVLQCMEVPGKGTSGVQTAAVRLGVYTPAGWTESSRLALALAGCLGHEGPAVYIGLNEFSPVMRITGRCKGYDLSDVAYAWRRGRLNYGLLERMTSHLDGFDGIPAPVNPAELAELSGSELEELLEAVCTVGGYLYAVIDFGSSISGRHTLFENCGRNLVLFPDTETGLLQQEEFHHFWETVGAQRLLEKTESIVLPLQELRGNKKGKTEEYMNELAKRLLRGSGKDDGNGGVLVCGGD